MAGSSTARKHSLWVDSLSFASPPPRFVAPTQYLNISPAEVKKDWVAGVLPGIQLVPSGVLAVNRAQEHGCTYCFAG